MRYLIVLLLILAIPSRQARAVERENIGSWVIICAGPGEPCLMRHSRRLYDQSGVTAELEVMAQGRSLVPVVILRGVPTELLMTASMTGSASLSIRFPGARPEVFGCVATSAGGLCAPSDDAAPRVAAEFARARVVTLRLTATAPGMGPLPEQQRVLDLTGTPSALSRLRIAGPTVLPGPAAALTSQFPAA